MFSGKVALKNLLPQFMAGMMSTHSDTTFTELVFIVKLIYLISGR